MVHYNNIYWSGKSGIIRSQEAFTIDFNENTYEPTLLRITTEKIRGAALSVGRRPVLVIMPGDSIWMMHDAKQNTFEFKGRYQAELDFCKKIWQSEVNHLSLSEFYFEMDVSASKVPLNQFLKNWYSLKQEGEALIAELSRTSGIRPEVAAFLTRVIRLRVFTLLTLPGEYQNSRDSLRMFSKSYTDSVDAEAHILTDYQNLPATASEGLVRALGAYVSYKCVEAGLYPTLKQKYMLAKQTYNGFQKAWACYWILESDGIHSNKNIAPLLQDYQRWVHPYDEFVRVLKGDPTVPLRSYKGTVFADSVIDPTTRHQRLSELLTRYKGQVVLLDLWASWCRPCIEEFPVSVALANKYRSKGLVVLFLSIDKDPAKWRQAFKHLPKGTHNLYCFSSLANSVFLKELEVTTVPRYVLIDRNGLVRYPDALRPSDPRFKEILEKMLLL